MPDSLGNWTAGLGAIIGCVLVQFFVQIFLMRAQEHGAKLDLADLHQKLPVLATLAFVLVLIFGHLLQVALWAVAYLALGELGGAQNAIYFSLASFTTVGAADLALSQSHRILGALEAGLGMLMFGWSTALLVAHVGRVQAAAERARSNQTNGGGRT